MSDYTHKLGNCWWRIISQDDQHVTAERKAPAAWCSDRATWPKAVWDRLAKEITK